MSKDSLVTVFSALSVHTRMIVQEEIDAALRDTNVEYHRAKIGEGQQLLEESMALYEASLACKQATLEFDNIHEDHDPHSE